MLVLHGSDRRAGGRLLWPCLAGVAMLLAATPLNAVEPEGDAQPPGPPWNRLYASSLTLARYNPFGMETQNRLTYSRRFSDSQSILFRDTFVALGPSLKFNPTSVKIGAVLDFQPIAVFNLRAGYEFADYFGLLGYLQSYSSRRVDFSDGARANTANSAYSTTGHHFFVEPTLQMKVGDIAVRTKFAFDYWDLRLKDQDSWFYDGALDTLVPVKRWVWSNDTDVVYLNERLMVGARFTGVFPDDDLNRHMRLGPILGWSFNTDEYTLFSRPTILCAMAWYLEHPSRSSGVPYLFLGFAFSSDLL